MKVSNLEKAPEFARKLREQITDDPNISLIEGYLDHADVFRLIANCDGFLSLHRAEGFGLGLAETMALGRVAIGTGWSGNMQFMREENSVLLDYELVVLEEDLGPYRAGQTWAETSVADASRKIIELCQQPARIEELGLQARTSIQRDFSPQAIGQLISARLAQLDISQHAASE
jgi:glycosyltransferase involved in cell wall biosynthesis